MQLWIVKGVSRLDLGLWSIIIIRTSIIILINYLSTLLGDMKIPDPIMVPTVSAIPPHTVTVLCKSTFFVSSFLLISN